jgi:hypothetical protein
MLLMSGVADRHDQWILKRIGNLLLWRITLLEVACAGKRPGKGTLSRRSGHFPDEPLPEAPVWAGAF